MSFRFLTLWLLMLLIACQPNSKDESFPAPAPPVLSEQTAWQKEISKSAYADKLLGALVGSAIGDAMGAPTEMWHRSYINMQKGYVDSLQRLVREGSPEGPWEDNLPEGGTTDDTRWKYLTANFLLKQPQLDSLNAKKFAAFIVEIYLQEMEQVKKVDAFAPEPLERELMHATWLQEWAKVAKPYTESNLDEYVYALDKFYGGEMACAGMLYAPMIGAIYPAMPERAYQESYRLGLFDIGYARDITGLTAALVAKAMQPNVTPEQILNVSYEVDPLRYFNSRLTGRIAYRIYEDAKRITYDAKQITTPTDKKLPHNFKYDALYYAQLEKAYILLDEKLQDIPFHAAEIHLINLTAIAFSEGDFQKAIEFVVNYGRDNDTVAAVTGMILGAYWGYEKLPVALREKALQVNKDVLGMDLQNLSETLLEKRYPQ
ncbi:MAG: ADP-ribosylglycohydrolase family protein [Saprospiraceae bacterium]|nr:ADP-ribosylglycohydrolase family protein [Saprospiraceae bacterium]